MLAIILLGSIDVLAESRRYLNDDYFQVKDEEDASAATPTAADIEISKDTSYYRVFNVTVDPFNDATTCYHHNAIGGYCPAKLSVMEDLLNFQLRKQPINLGVLDMLNAKYFIVPGQNNQPMVQVNPNALGPCWFVHNIHYAKDPLAAMKALDNINAKDTVIIEEAYKTLIPFSPVADSMASIKMVQNDNDFVTYTSTSKTNQFAVFSEVYYDRGWKAYVDDKETPIVKVDYLLRGLPLPAGNHLIRFEFKPASYYESLTIAIVASGIGWIAINCRNIFYNKKNKKKEKVYLKKIKKSFIAFKPCSKSMSDDYILKKIIFYSFFAAGLNRCFRGMRGTLFFIF